MHNIVLDASVVLGWFEEGSQAESALTIHDDIIKGDIAAWAPDFLLLEAANILYWRKKLSQSEIEATLQKIFSVGINFDDSPIFGEIQSIISLVIKHRVSAYDAQYLRLAQKLNCKLFSFDKDLLKIRDWVVAPSQPIFK